MNTHILKIIKTHYVLITSLIILTALLFRNPYSTRTLIPNLEPFPDAMYYTTTPRCFLNGQDWRMCRLDNQEIEGIKPAVPPAYSLAILPTYFINSDVRTFYFANILLSFISLILLYKVSKNFFTNKYIVGIILFLYITNYFIYWYPTLAMAENLLIPIFLMSVLLLQQKKSTIKFSVLAGITASSFYATKYAFAPLTLTFPILYLIKIWQNSATNTKDKIQQLLAAAIPGGSVLLSLVGIPQLIDVLNQILNGAIHSNSSKTITSGGSYFSMSYFTEHIKEYSFALIGKSQRFLWDRTPLTENWIAFSGLFGLLVGFKNKKYNLAKIWLILAIVSQLLFISTFYVVDIRYVFHFLPILLLGFGFFLQFATTKILKTSQILFFAIILAIYLVPNIVRLKSTVMVNLKYSETPWWYLSQLQMNNYFDNLETINIENKPILITLSAPFLTDNYSNQNYTTLPLNNQQDFRGSMPQVWGPNNYNNLIDLYKEKINSNTEVYITNYGVSAASHFQSSYSEIKASFNLKEVRSGCHNLCNIYKLEINND